MVGTIKNIPKTASFQTLELFQFAQIYGIDHMVGSIWYVCDILHGM